MKLLFKYPTRARLDWFKQTLEKYYEMMSGSNPFQFLITLDDDDEQMNSEEARWFMEQFRGLSYQYNNHQSKIEACNADMDLLTDWDIVILVSDDMVPQQSGFDIQIVDDMETHFPDTDGCLFYDDGLFSKDNTSTLSILGRKYYDRFGYIYHPDYKSFYCDNEYTEVARSLGKMAYSPNVIIKHEWTGGGGSEDALYRRNTRLGKPDEATYNRRKAAGFPK